MSDEDCAQVEATGETVGEAKWAALRELERLSPGSTRRASRFQVVSEGERGLLGVGYEPARVIAVVAEDGAVARRRRRRRESPSSPRRSREVLERIAAALGVRCRIDVAEEDDDARRPPAPGRDLGLLIGKHGQTIDAIQYLVNAIASGRRPDERKAIVVDAAGYRAGGARRSSRSRVRAAERARGDGRRVELEPMTAVERKVVHVPLKDYPGSRRRARAPSRTATSSSSLPSPVTTRCSSAGSRASSTRPG